MNDATAFFDTHKFVKNLTGNGFTVEQAEVLAEEQANLLNSNLVTNERLAAVEARLLERMETIKSDLTKWMAGLMVGMVGVIIALVKFL